MKYQERKYPVEHDRGLSKERKISHVLKERGLNLYWLLGISLEGIDYHEVF